MMIDCGRIVVCVEINEELFVGSKYVLAENVCSVSHNVSRGGSDCVNNNTLLP
jgi:hypothetical protein